MGCGASRVGDEEPLNAHLSQLVLSLPLTVRLPFDEFLSTLPAYAASKDSVFFYDAIARTWADLIGNGSRDPSSVWEWSFSTSNLNDDLWKQVEGCYVKFRARRLSHGGSTLIREHLEAATQEAQWIKEMSFSSNAVFEHLSAAMGVVVRMLALFPFQPFLLSPHCDRLVAGLRAEGGGHPLDLSPINLPATAPERGSLTGEGLADRLVRAQEAARARTTQQQLLLQRQRQGGGGRALRAAWLARFTATAEALPCMVSVADMLRPDQPIIWTNREFQRVTGYSQSETRNRNCRFLQGKTTSRESISLMRQAIDAHQPHHCEILNYTKRGVPFRNFLTIKPVWETLPGEGGSGEQRRVAFYIGVQFDASVLSKRGGGEEGKDGAAAPSAVPGAEGLEDNIPLRILELEALISSLPDEV
jgi:PAS domain-containing protein